MTAVTISVTARDIAAGKPGESCGCPVWIAACRAMPWLAARLAIGALDLVISEPGHDPDGAASAYTALIPLPLVAQAAISAFDDYNPVSPFSFEIDIPDHLMPAEVTP